MAKEIEFKVGQEYPLTLNNGNQVTITIKEIDVPNRDIVFMIAGDGVERPGEPRRLNVFALTEWMLAHEDKQ